MVEIIWKVENVILMCHYCAAHKELIRDRSIHAVEDGSQSLGGSDTKKRTKWLKFQTIHRIKTDEVPDDLFFLRAALAAEEDGTLAGGDG